MKRFFLFSIISLLLSCSTPVWATHYMGSEITYECLGGNQYEIKLVTFSDCSAINPGTSVTLSFSSSCSNFNQNLSLVAGYPHEITAACPSTQTTCNGGSAYGVQQNLYTATVTLAACADWIISYDACCRNSSLLNISNPSSQSHYIATTLDNSAATCNTSPTFVVSPITTACMNDTSYHSFNAFDLDGDSLVYSLAPCLQSAGLPVNYATGFSAASPVAGSISIDNETGLLTIVPTMAHSAIFCVKVDEYRNGVKIGETTREFQLSAMNCTNNLPKVHQINGSNIAFNSQHTVTVGQTLSLNFSFTDIEVQLGTQVLAFSTYGHPNFMDAVINSTTYNVSFTPTISDVGTHYLTVYVKDDACAYSGENHYTVKVTVLSTPFVQAIDDVFLTSENTLLTDNFMSNDVANVPILANVIPHIFPTNGTITISTSGNFTYVPTTNFIGLDSFDYIICSQNSLCDTATVYINTQPSTPIIHLTDTLILGESFSSYYCFSDSAFYQSDTSDNVVLTFVNDSCLTIYADYLGSDTFTVASANEVVNFYLTVVNGVWPGDTDDDAIANNVDLLNIGLAYGTPGIPRDSQTISWNGYFADDWQLTFPNGLNAKYADANGDGLIDANDTLAIVQNWGLTYNKNGGGNGIPLYLATNALTITNDSVINIPIMLGDVQTPVSSIYGLAFSVTYNWELVKEGSAYIRFDSTWLGSTQNIISIQKDFYNNEIIETAVTRIDGNNTNGFGQIGTLGFTIQDDIIRGGDSTFSFNILNTRAIESDATIVDVQGLNQDILWQTLIDIANSTTTANLSNHLKIYPNPVANYLTISAKAVRIKSIAIFDVMGQKMISKYDCSDQNQLDLSMLNDGFYIMRIETNQGFYSEKILVRKP